MDVDFHKTLFDLQSKMLENSEKILLNTNKILDNNMIHIMRIIDEKVLDENRLLQSVKEYRKVKQDKDDVVSEINKIKETMKQCSS